MQEGMLVRWKHINVQASLRALMPAARGILPGKGVVRRAGRNKQALQRIGPFLLVGVINNSCSFKSNMVTISQFEMTMEEEVVK